MKRILISRKAAKARRKFHIPNVNFQFGDRISLEPVRLCVSSVFLSTVFAALPAMAADATGPVTGQIDAAVTHGVDFLVSQQQADGEIGVGQSHVAASGLSLLALLACGNTPDVGRNGTVVRQLIDYLASVEPDDGYFGKLDGSRMYGQGIVTLALAEALGVETTEARRNRLVGVLNSAMKVILAAQDVPKPPPFAGGWRYEPNSADSDLSQAAWNAMALRACQDAGLAVPKSAVARAGEFVLRCYRADQNGFAYQPGQGASACETAVGIFCLHVLDIHDNGEADGASKTLLATKGDPSSPFTYYALFYLTQAANQSGQPAWDAVWPGASATLLRTQEPAGSWPVSDKELEDKDSGKVYATAMAVLTLSVPYRLLPIDQK
jgi:hypothetical protein